MLPTRGEIVRAYRSLFRSGLQAVQFSIPARYYLRDTLRKAFREGILAEFDHEKIANTILFLNKAAKEKGMEHKIIKNILQVRYFQRKVETHPQRVVSSTSYTIRNKGYREFEETIEKLNQSLQMSLR